MEPPEVKHERLFLVSVAGLFVNLIGIFALNHGGHGHSHGTAVAINIAKYNINNKQDIENSHILQAS